MPCLSTEGTLTTNGIAYTPVSNTQLPSGLNTLNLIVVYNKEIEVKPDLIFPVFRIAPSITIANGVIATTTAGEITNSFSLPINYTSSTTFNVNYFTVRWYLALVDGRVVPDPDAPCKVFKSLNLNAALPEPPNGTNTTMIIEATTTPDKQRICQVDYIVTNPRGTCTCQEETTLGTDFCEKVSYSNSSLNDDEKVARFRVYRLDLTQVLCNPVLPIPEALERYALARLMLSKLIFGDFIVAYLRKSYYNKFLDKIQECYANWLPFFTPI